MPKQKLSIIQKALKDIATAWGEMKTTPVNMSVEEFERRVLKVAKRDGTPYSTESGKWLDMAKQAITSPSTSQEEKNLYLAEADPPELRPAIRKFIKSFTTLSRTAEWSYKDLNAFVNDSAIDERLRTFLRWRALLPAEAFHKYNRLRLRGKKSHEAYLKLRPTVIFRSK